jgi:hypothetical protein
METKFVLAVVAGAIILYAQLVLSEDATAPVSRAEAKAEAQDAEGVGILTPAGQGSPGDEASSPKSQLAKTRAQSRAKTPEARQESERFVEAPGLKDERGKETVSATMSRAQRMAQTRALVQAGKLDPAGQGQDAPKK